MDFGAKCRPWMCHAAGWRVQLTLMINCWNPMDFTDDIPMTWGPWGPSFNDTSCLCQNSGIPFSRLLPFLWKQKNHSKKAPFEKRTWKIVKLYLILSAPWHSPSKYRACPEVGQHTVWEEDMNMDGHGSFFVRHARISDKQTRWHPHLDTFAGW